MEQSRENRSEEVGLARGRREALEVGQRSPGIRKTQRGENLTRAPVAGRSFEERSPVSGLGKRSLDLPVGEIGYLASSQKTMALARPKMQGWRSDSIRQSPHFRSSNGAPSLRTASSSHRAPSAACQ